MQQNVVCQTGTGPFSAKVSAASKFRQSFCLTCGSKNISSQMGGHAIYSFCQYAMQLTCIAVYTRTGCNVYARVPHHSESYYHATGRLVGVTVRVRSSYAAATPPTWPVIVLPYFQPSPRKSVRIPSGHRRTDVPAGVYLYATPGIIAEDGVFSERGNSINSVCYLTVIRTGQITVYHSL